MDAYEHPAISDEEIDYLLDLANTYLAQPLARSDVVVDLQRRASALRRRLRPIRRRSPATTCSSSTPSDGRGAAVLSIYGGKITTYRKLAEHALQELAPFLPPMKPRWTAHAVLPGGDLPPGGLAELRRGAHRALSGAARPSCCAASRTGMARAPRRSWATRRTPADLGEDFGQGLTAAEIDYLVDEEWARSGDDDALAADQVRARHAAGRSRSRRGATSPVGWRERSADCGRSPRMPDERAPRDPRRAHRTSTTRCRRTAG